MHSLPGRAAQFPALVSAADRPDGRREYARQTVGATPARSGDRATGAPGRRGPSLLGRLSPPRVPVPCERLSRGGARALTGAATPAILHAMRLAMDRSVRR